MSELPTLRTMQLDASEPGIWVARFNRPEVLNALNTDTSRDLRDLFGPLRSTPGNLRCVILTGTGTRAFSAGGDLKERQGMSNDEWRLQHAIIEEGAYAVLNASVPVIAAVNGLAMGGGLELALCCDFIYAVRGAKLALPEVSRGIIPGTGGTQNLPRAIGMRRAKELILTAQHFTTEEAYAWGLVNELCDPERVLPRAIETARLIAANAPIAVRQAKLAINQGQSLEMTAALALEVLAYERTIATEDRLEGVRAFNERRTAHYQGR